MQIPGSNLLHLWGKLGANTYPDHYQPLINHMIDVGTCGQLIWDRVPLCVRHDLAIGLGFSESDIRPWIGFWTAAHDIGKAIPGFQFRGKTESLRKALTDLGFNEGGGKAPFHADASVPILELWMTNRNFPPKFIGRITFAIGGHHGLFPTKLTYSEHDLGNKQWRDLQEKLLDELARVFHVPVACPSGGLGYDQSAFLFLAGLTTVADWIGSNEEWFPWSPLKLDQYESVSFQYAQIALNTIKWPKPNTGALTGGMFAEVFKYALGKHTPRPLQLACEEITKMLNGPSLVLVEAPMGEGKTEAALYIADWWRRKTGAGAYVALPTMATSNGMFTRVRDFLENTVPEWTQLHLLHGQAILSDNYEELKKLTIYDHDHNSHGVMADSWFAAQKKQAILAPFGVGTIDQALLAVLQTKHFFLRLFGLAGKTIILDEVHAYDTYMSTLMELLLKWLAALRCPIVLLSATLPEERRKKLLRAYAGENAVEQGENCGYPRVSWTASNGPIYSRHVEPDSTRQVTISLRNIQDESLGERLKTALKDGGCACIIRNTVGKAQETYTLLKQSLNGTSIEIMLFHARFLFGRRDEIEKEVLKFFGKEGPRPQKMVLVATQVVEQSLDLDFDLMATDIAPIDLILQRSGRLHRHAGRNRPPSLQTPQLWLIEPGEKIGQPDFKHSEYIYERYVLLRTWEVIREKRELQLPGEIEGLIEAVYAERAETETDLVESKNKMKVENKNLEDNAKTVLAPKPVLKSEFWENKSLNLEEDDDPKTHKTRHAATRDVRPTVQLVIAYMKNGHEFLDPKCNEPMAVNHVPSRKDMIAILRNAVASSHPGCFHNYAFKDPPNGWMKSGLLKYYRLVRVGQDGVSLVDEFAMRVDSELGLQMKRETLEE